MPTYTATADIYNVMSSKIVAELTDDTDGTTANDTYIDSALDRAESLVDSYVGKVYTVPLATPVEKSITHAVLTLAKCMLFRRRHGAIPAEAKDECDAVVKWLEDIATGEIELDDDLTGADTVAEQDNDDEVFDAQVFGR
jgi:phage gp36-like protein